MNNMSALLAALKPNKISNSDLTVFFQTNNPNVLRQYNNAAIQRTVLSLAKKKGQHGWYSQQPNGLWFVHAPTPFKMTREKLLRALRIHGLS